MQTQSHVSHPLPSPNSKVYPKKEKPLEEDLVLACFLYTVRNKGKSHLIGKFTKGNVLKLNMKNYFNA